MKNVNDLYSIAHMVVSAIRLYEYQKGGSPSVEDICKSLGFSLEQGHFICKKLHDRKVIEKIEGAFGTKLCILNHLLIEEIPKKSEEKSIADEVKKFQQAQKKSFKKIESLQAEKKKEKKDLFAEIDRQLKEGLKKT